ncbi:hypothetical protein SAMN04487886_100338 [Clostridium sp. DSM 8431]|uniref:hypothetical protein n=1 Tax=Clostridium sp. DSM 8431 TaxID=1761781 RepID=UPI0008E29283|nr:hypothetical protein [Clostridium sp. DSM 8431]SFU29459.1 hypothetical protein SAMN04487886_100338 [Clostridium sp. DSM 8431]
MSSIEKIKSKNVKGSTLCCELIQCNEEKHNARFYTKMRDGYIKMGKINLQLASDDECELVEINNYETWLCGV